MTNCVYLFISNRFDWWIDWYWQGEHFNHSMYISEFKYLRLIRNLDYVKHIKSVYDLGQLVSQ